MIRTDYHLHSDFSGDCKAPMEDVIEKAIEKGMTHICFTEHHDLDFPECDINFELDIPAYFEKVTAMKAKYKGQIKVLMGIEMGMQSHIYDQLNDLVAAYHFDFVLASNHLGQGVDPYQPTYFSHSSKKEGYTIYFKDILFNVKYFDNYDIYGHLDYVMRYYPHGEKMYKYTEYEEILDQILRLIIRKGKGIELNTSGLRKGLGTPNPIPDVFRRYYEMGGRMLTIGSDAHTPEDLLADFDYAENLLKEIGFEGYYIFENRIPTFVPFEK